MGLIKACSKSKVFMKRAFAIVSICLLLAAPVGICAEPGSGVAPANARGSRDRIICRRFLRTGSLVDSYRTCKTRAEWDREHENLQQLSVSNSCRNPLGCDP
jgi:hypothetical protein